MEISFESFKKIYEQYNQGGSEKSYYPQLMDDTNSRMILRASVPESFETLGGPYKHKDMWHVPIFVRDYRISPRVFTQICPSSGMKYDLIKEILEKGEEHPKFKEIVWEWQNYEGILLNDDIPKKIITYEDCSFVTFGSKLEIGLREPLNLPNPIYGSTRSKIYLSSGTSFVIKDLMH